MPPTTGEVIVTAGDCAGHTVPTRHAWHHRFPQVWAEGSTPFEAAHRLEELLIRVLDSAPSASSRQEVQEALGDVRAYLSEHRPAAASPAQR